MGMKPMFSLSVVDEKTFKSKRRVRGIEIRIILDKISHPICHWKSANRK